MKSIHALPHHQTTNRWGCFWICVAVACFIGLGARLLYIRTELSPKLLAYRSAQQTRTDQVRARRGSIFDTRGRLLAGSETKPSLFADPQLVEDVDETASQLSAIIGMSTNELAKKIRNRRHTRFVWLARKVAPTEAAAVSSLRLQGVGIQDEPHRFYPNGKALAHLLGFVNSECEGLEGLELQFDDILSGEPGVYQTWCDARRRPLWTREERLTAPVDGQHLVLTIDLVIQKFLQDALEKPVEKFQAESAVGIVISPQNGDVLAMACYPTFDPNYHLEYPAKFKRNRCLTDPVEPGSCFKPIIMSAALAEGVASLDETVDCGSGVWYFGKRRLRDTHANGVLTFEQVLVKSSNIGMGHIGTRLGNRRLHDYVRAFGFGERTGIDLPGENAGIVLPLRRWTSYSKTSIPIGQELAVTPIQLITAFAALLNGGELREPNIVRAVLGPTGRKLPSLPKQQTVRQVIPTPIADAIAKRALARLVNESAHDIKLKRYQMIGKTGTAQVPYRDRRGYEPDAYLGSFLGGAPAYDPVVAVLVMVRKPNKSLGYYGGTVAGPAVREVIEKTLAYWDIPPDRQVLEQTATRTENYTNGSLRAEVFTGSR